MISQTSKLNFVARHYVYGHTEDLFVGKAFPYPPIRLLQGKVLD